MKKACVRKIICGLFLAAASFCNAQVTVSGADTAPTILAQPSSQTAAYGANVSFNVSASGQGLKYVWQKNGWGLADYNNIAGAHNPTLHIVGAALDDAGSYQVIIFNSSGNAITSSVVTLSLNSTVIFADDFENGRRNWLPLLDSAPLALNSSRNHTPGGSNSVLAINGPKRIYHSLPKKVSGRVRYSFWMYDDGKSKMAYGELVGYNGEVGYAKYVNKYGRGLQQSLAIGYRVPTGTNVEARLEVLDPTKYQARVLRGTNAGWVNLNAPGTPNRSIGWHKFEIHRHKNEQTVEFYVDGVLGRTIHGAKPADIDTLMLGAWEAPGTNNLAKARTSCSFDDVSLEAYPSTFNYRDSLSLGPIPTLMQLRETGTNALMAAITPGTVSEAAGSTMQALAGNWAVVATGIVAQGVRGQLACTVNAPADDMYRVEIEGREEEGKIPGADLPINVWIDGEYLGHYDLASAQANGLVHCFTPFIRAGAHTVTVEWDNARPRRSLYVQAVRLQSLHTTDVTDTGMKKWVAHRLAAQNGLEVVSSRTSPACIEGRGRYLSMMSLAAGTAYPLSPLPVLHSAGFRWYANVPLSASNITRIEISYQNGGLAETNDVEWQVSNIFDVGNLMIRRGDALLLDAVPVGVTNGTTVISIGTDVLQTDVATPVPYRFDQPGTFKVTGTYGSFSKTITVKVVDASLDPVVAVASWRSHWDCTNLPPEVVLDSDPRLVLEGIRPLRKIRKSTKPAPVLPQGRNVRSFRVSNASPQEPRYVVARVGGNGPIIASSAIQGVRLAIPPETSLKIVGRLDDGSQIIEGTYLLAPTLPSLTLGIHIATGGVTFDDGTIDKLLKPADFNAVGLCRIRFVRAPNLDGSVCHVCQVYDNGVLIDRR